MADAELVGYQAIESWMGQEYLTLADVLPEQPRAVIVGINPSPVSVAAGHYYQGRVGQRQLQRLAATGLFEFPEEERTFEAAALAAGVGFTDIVKRPTVGEKDLESGELEHGRESLAAKLKSRGVPLVVCVFRQPVEALLGKAGVPGVQTERTEWGAQVFRMPGPFSSAADAAAPMSELSAVLRQA